VAEGEARGVLDRLARRGLVRHGAYLADTPEPQYVHIAVLDEIQRRQVHARRGPRPVATAEQFSAFLLRRHHLHPDHRLVGPPGVLAALELLQGEDFPVRVWEQDLLPARVEQYEREWLDRLGLSGAVVWTVFEPRRAGEAARPGRVGVALRENLGWLRDAASTPTEMDERTKNVLLHLQLRGASFVQDLARLAGLDAPRAQAALWQLFWSGLASPDSFSIVAGAARPAPTVGGLSETRPGSVVAGAVRPAPTVGGLSQTRRGSVVAGAARPGPTVGGLRKTRRGSVRRGQARGPLRQLPGLGRWSALGEDERLSPEERDEARAQLLLARYGVVARELAPGDWATLRHTLLRMEYGGEVVRGYFVEGLSGEQYAQADALADLGTVTRRAEPHVLVNLVDPANLWGRVLALTRLDGARAAVARLPHAWLVFRAGRPILLAEGYGRDLTPLAGWEPVDFPGAVRAFQGLMDRPLTLRPVRRLEVLTWSGRPVRESEAFAPLVAAGFAVDGPRLSWDGYPGPRHRA
jgi:ATP-dependent Lhr-like helicase